MANTVTSTVLLNGNKRQVVHLYIAGDGTGEVTTSTVYNYATDTYAPTDKTALRVEKINVGNDAFSPLFSWDGTTPFVVWDFGNNGVTHGDGVDFSGFGGIRNLAGVPNGNLTVTTVGLGAGEHMTAILVIRKA